MFPDIHKFTEDGVTRSEDRVMKKGFVTNRIIENMRGEGYVPVLDMYPMMQTEYWPEKDLFKYTIVVYGVKADNPWNYEGWLEGRFLPATTKTKSKQFYSLWESV